MKIAHYDQIITPEVGEPAAGYGTNDVTVRIHDDLKLTILLLDDGENIGAVLGYDLIGLDAPFAQKLRKDTAALLKCPESNVILSCTHTHSGPHTRSLVERPATKEYVENLFRWTDEGVRAAMKLWTDADVYFYSCKCDTNYNRRYVDGSNRCHWLPKNRSLEPLAGNEFKDQELGMLIFTLPGTRQAQGVLVNYAAHPLASHTPGIGAHQVSADYPGAMRDMMEDSCCWCVFTDGAAGDMFPKDSECGWESVKACASALTKAAIRGILDAARNPALYKLEDPKIKSSIEKVDVKFRKSKLPVMASVYAGKPGTTVELQLFTLGDICLVGVPGEMLSEVGQEIKWNSPYRRTFILYNSTSYVGYIPPTTVYVAGGYEYDTCRVQPYSSLKMVNAVVEGMRRLHGPLPDEL